MNVRTLALILSLVGASCSSEPSDKTSDASAPNMADMDVDSPINACEERQNSFSMAVDNLSTSCTVDEDCETVVGIEDCGCIGAASVDSDLEELRRIRGGFDQDCYNPLACFNNSFCWHDGLNVNEFVAACVDGACVPDPDYSCDQIDELVAGATRCAEDADCEVRSDVGACGCPTAVSTDASDTLRYTARLRDTCDYSDVCAVIDCAVGTTAQCVDQRCELVP